ncbi:pituitary adenylate cyclase-activating polypeptide type I receptor-like isoform X2 [Corythoichthys intestinalis]|uniref:pituitary adenylate cyclase-activating polypeptide type I receptor-like isoform X2 n=1 Tax=Corythoichthys intestinalis TaxID=161448 RepID=UPI0025A55016|nr:pituitary adenylate cyclase-activating polypeptide type I receptor-like isoform X2 [Corythoichthys intestinalis]
MREIKRSDQGIFCKFQERFLLFLCLCVPMMEAIHPDCAIIAQHLRAREICSQARSREVQNQTAHGGCQTEWDEIGCWLRADVGQVVNVSCSDVFQHYSSGHGFVFRNCTASGWSDIFPPYEEVCAFRDDSSPETETSYLSTFRQVYTVGYATSLISLVTAVVVFTAFRKFHCTRNYIHINLFSSFILRASAVFIKDTVLFADETLDHCSVSTTACKSAVAFFQFSILANYFWLLVEGMYLQTLLALTFVSQRMYFWWYILIGWGLPSTILILWVLTRFFYDDRGCWDDTDNVAIWWIIKGPITASLLLSYQTGQHRHLCQRDPHPGAETQIFRHVRKQRQWAFYGFVVALLYCFMNGEVQAELRRWLWKCHNQSQRTPAKRSLSQVSMGARGGLRRTPSTGIVSTV